MVSLWLLWLLWLWPAFFELLALCLVLPACRYETDFVRLYENALQNVHHPQQKFKDRYPFGGLMSLDRLSPASPRTCESGGFRHSSERVSAGTKPPQNCLLCWITVNSTWSGIQYFFRCFLPIVAHQVYITLLISGQWLNYYLY